MSGMTLDMSEKGRTKLIYRALVLFHSDHYNDAKYDRAVSERLARDLEDLARRFGIDLSEDDER